MRILFILEYYYPHIGGVETFFHTLIQELDRQGHDITVFTNRHHRGLPALEAMGQNITIVRKRYYNRYLFTFFSWSAAMRYAKGADLIHTTSYNAAIPAWVAAKLSRTKVIITFHERWGKLWYRLPWMSYPAKVLHHLFEWIITRLSFDKYIGVSEYTKHALLDTGLSPDIVTKIYNGINYDGWPSHRGSLSNQPFTFLYFGRVGYAKGLDLLIRAYQIVVSQLKDHRLILVLPSENSSLLKRIKSLIQEYQIGHQIEIIHNLPHDELLTVISTADAVVIPSYSEGFCFAAAETMAIGTPIISSGQGALSEVVGGIHIESVSLDPEDLADAMIDGIKGKWKETEAKKFHLSDTILAYQHLYKELLNNDGA